MYIKKKSLIIQKNTLTQKKKLLIFIKKRKFKIIKDSLLTKQIQLN